MKFQKVMNKPISFLNFQTIYTTMKPNFDVQQVFISTAALFGIGVPWFNFNKKVFTTVHHLISTPFAEEKRVTWKEPVSEERRLCEDCFEYCSGDNSDLKEEECMVCQDPID